MTESPGDGNRPSLQPKLPLLILIAGVVLAFRFLAWRNPSEYIEIPESVALPLSLVGIVYLVCGVWVWIRKPTRLTRVFLASGVGGCVHWGGSIAAENVGFEMATLTLYLAVTAIGGGAFLDLALRYPRAFGRPLSRTVIFYTLGIVTMVAVPIVPFLPRSAVSSGLGTGIMIAFMMSIAGGVVFILKWFSARSDERGRYALTPIVLVLVATSVLDLLADNGTLPGIPEAWSLFYALDPIVMAWALLRINGGESLETPSRD